MAGGAYQHRIVNLVAGEGIGAVEGVIHRAGGVVLFNQAAAVDAVVGQPVSHQLALGLAVLGHAAGQDDQRLRVGLGQLKGGLQAAQQDLVHAAVGIEGVAQGDDGAFALLGGLELIPGQFGLQRGGGDPLHPGDDLLQIGGAAAVAIRHFRQIAAGGLLVALHQLPDGEIAVDVEIIGGDGLRLLQQGDGAAQVAVVDLGVGRRDEQVGAVGFKLVGGQQPLGHQLHIARHLGGKTGVGDLGWRLVDLQRFAEQHVHRLALADQGIEVVLHLHRALGRLQGEGRERQQAAEGEGKKGLFHQKVLCRAESRRGAPACGPMG